MNASSSENIVALGARAKRLVRLSTLIAEGCDLKKAGHEWAGLCPFHAEKSPSFTVNDAKGFYHCFGCGAHGDAISWLRARFGLAYRAAVMELAGRVGLVNPDSFSAADAAPRTARPRAAEGSPVAMGTMLPRASESCPPNPSLSADSEDLAEKNKTIQWCRRIWRNAHPAAGTLVEDYLRGRGLDLERLGGVPPTLRFAKLAHRESGRVLACMVAPIQDGAGDVVGIHRTFLREIRGQVAHDVSAVNGWVDVKQVATRMVVKADVSPVKKMNGRAGGGAVRLAAAAPVMGVAEGIETALSVQMVTGLPCWAALSLGNLGRVELPDLVEQVLILADNDMKDPVAQDAALRRAANGHLQAGRKVRRALPPRGMDFNDLLRRE